MKRHDVWVFLRFVLEANRVVKNEQQYAEVTHLSAFSVSGVSLNISVIFFFFFRNKRRAIFSESSKLTT